MKTIALAAAVSLSGTAAFAGDIGPVATDAQTTVIMEPKPSGSGALTWVIPLIAIAAIALAAED